MRILARYQFFDPGSAAGRPWIHFRYLIFSKQSTNRLMVKPWVKTKQEANDCSANPPICAPFEPKHRRESSRPARRFSERQDEAQRAVYPCRTSIRDFSRAMKLNYPLLSKPPLRQRGRQRPAGYQRIQHRSRHAAHRYVRQSLVRIRRTDRTASCTRLPSEG